MSDSAKYRGRARKRAIFDSLEEEAVLWNGCDSALIGVTDGRAVYGRQRLVRCFVRQGMTWEEADEWVSFNIEGAYVGPLTPVIVREVSELREE